MNERLENPESGNEEVAGLIERLREIHIESNNGGHEELNKEIMLMHRQHPEWATSSAWHRLIGSTPRPEKPMTFDMPDGSVGIFIKQLAEKFLP